MNEKPFWQSKTFWTNIILAGGLVAASQTGMAEPTAGETASVFVTANLFLRYLTKGAITLS